MTHSKAYITADPFERKLMREISAGIHLTKRGWGGEPLPADVHTLTSVLKWYRDFKKVQAS